MRIKGHVSLIESTLRHNGAARPFLSSIALRNHHRRFATSADPANVAILGGGISGLASAHFISKEFPKSKITVFESSKEVGGWIKSRKVNLASGEVLFEHGPRTLRPGPGALATAKLVEELGLTEEVLYTSKNAPGARNRYIYYPDRLNRLPGSIEDIGISTLLPLFNSGILDGVFNTLREPFQPQRPHGLQDESIGDFISRRVDKRLANNVVSAVFHGIYAGDIYQLSARTLLTTAWNLEGRYGSALWGAVRLQQDSSHPEPQALWHPSDWDQFKSLLEDVKVSSEFSSRLASASTFTFKHGLQSLPQKLESSLRAGDQVEILTETPVHSFKRKPGSDQIEVSVGPKDSPSIHDFDFCISTLPDPAVTPAVTVMTVNLFYSNPSLIPYRGFGYLIPRSVPFEQNPERALGCIFDHDAVSGQDSISGTKLTVMLGGHWWNDWKGLPDDEEGLDLAKSVIRRHLNITDEPDVSHVTLNRDCIPQYTVGYEDRLKDFATELRDTCRGRVRVVGSQFNGVGVNDCVRGAWLVARGMRESGWKGRSVGLDRALDERPLIVQPSMSIAVRQGLEK